MKDYDYRGDWYLPGSEKKFPGRVSINEETKSITLEVFGDKTIEGTVIKNLFDYERQRFHPLVLGDCGGQVTLYNCTPACTQAIGKAMYQIEYRAQFLFMAIHIVNPDFLVQSATFKYPYLASWYDGWQSLDKIKLAESAEFGIEVDVGEGEPDYIAVTDNLTLALYDKVSRRMIEVGVHHSVKYQKNIAFTYRKPVSFEDLISDAIILKKLLEFTYGKPIPYKLVAIKVPKEFISIERDYLFENEKVVTCYVASYELHKGKDVNKHDRHQNYMLVSRWNCSKDELNQIVRNWYVNKHLHNIYDYYIDSNNWLQDSDAQISNVMFNNRFLNLVQALEDYHRKCMNHGVEAEQDFLNKKQQVLTCIKDAALKKWLNDNFKPPKHIKLEEKLEAILELIKPIFLPSLTDHPIFTTFPTYAKNKRNELSHGMNKETYQGAVFHVNFYLARIILGVCIMHSLEVIEINKKINRNLDWNSHLHQIIQFKV